MKKNILVTGAAGFIGFHLIKKLVNNNFVVYGLDNFSPSYELKIKKLRIEILKKKRILFL